MPIVDITPVGSKSYEKSTKINPIFLVLAEDSTSMSKYHEYLAIRLDESPYSIKIVAIEVTKYKNILQTYQEILNSADKTLYIEIQLPWQRVVRIQNLIFKQK